MAAPIQPAWKNEQLPPEFLELRKQLEFLPGSFRDRLLALCERVGHYTQLQSRLVRIAQDAVDQLQLDNKYLLFDLEATRRERDELRQEMEEL